jgi:UDP:flavonoid glycosyltransferase YjiC (YdhE family)
MTRYRDLIDRLVRDDHEILFAVRSLAAAVEVFDERKVALVQAPLRMEVLKEGVASPRSYLHVLKNQGFADPEGLSGRFKAWLALYERWQPDLIVSDHSPTAVFAAQYYRDAKLVMSGCGFAVPPDRHPFQAFAIAPLLTRDALLEEEKIFLEKHVNPLVQAVGGSRYDRLCDVFKSDARWLCQFSEIDHYPERGAENHLGTGYGPAGESPRWPGGQGGRVFAYMKPHRDLAELLGALRRIGMPTLIKGDQLPAAIEAQFSGPTIKFVDKLQDMTEVAASCDLGITNSGAAATAQFLLAGKPVLLLPTEIEQLLSAKAIERNGYGISVDYFKELPFAYEKAIAELTAPGNS